MARWSRAGATDATPGNTHGTSAERKLRRVLAGLVFEMTIALHDAQHPSCQPGAPVSLRPSGCSNSNRSRTCVTHSWALPVKCPVRELHACDLGLHQARFAVLTNLP